MDRPIKVKFVLTIAIPFSLAAYIPCPVEVCNPSQLSSFDCTCDPMPELEEPLLNSGPFLKGLVLIGPDTKPIREFEGVEGIQIEGLCVPVDEKHLSCLLGPIFERPITKTLIQYLEKKLIYAFRELGYPLVVIHPPAQEITRGILQFQVTISRLDDYICAGNRWFSDQAIVNPMRIQRGEPISAKILLDDVSWLNRNPFRRTDIVFSAGKEDYTTAIELVTHDRFLLRPYVGGDNTGTKPLGRTRWFAGFDWGQAFTANHILSYQFTTASDVTEMHSHTIHYTAYLPWRNTLVLYGGYSTVHPHLTDFHSNGYNAQGSLRYEVPLYPSYLSMLQSIWFGFDVKSMNNDLIFIGEEPIPITKGVLNLTQLMGEYSMGYEAGCHKFLAQAEVFISPGEIIANQEDKDFEHFRAGADNTYYYGRLNTSYRYHPIPAFELYMQGRVQWTSRVLIPSEEFPLGGYDTVRGYEEREFLGDRGYCFNLELRSSCIDYKTRFGERRVDNNLTFLAFLDLGVGNNVIQEELEKRNATLFSIGPGLRYSLGTYVNVRADYGFQLKKPPYSESELGRFHVGAIVSY